MAVIVPRVSRGGGNCSILAAGCIAFEVSEVAVGGVFSPSTRASRDGGHRDKRGGWVESEEGVCDDGGEKSKSRAGGK